MGYIDITPHFGEVDLGYIDLQPDMTALIRVRNRMPYHVSLSHVFSDNCETTNLTTELHPGQNITRRVFEEDFTHPEVLPKEMKIEY